MPQEQKTSEHLTEEQKECYLSGSLSAAEAMQVAEHLSECRGCREALSAVLPVAVGTGQMLTSLFQFPRLLSEHLDDETLSAYVGNRVDTVEGEMVEEHLQQCRVCRTEVEELRSLLAGAERLPLSQEQPTPTPSWRERLVTGLRVPHTRQTLGYALATGLVVFFVTRFLLLAPEQQKRLDQREHVLASREAALNQKESAIKKQEQSLTQHKQTVADDQKKAKRDQAPLKAREEQFAQLQRGRILPTPLPDPSKLSSPALPDSGVHIVIPAGDTPNKNAPHEDPVPFALLSPLPGQSVCHDRVTFRWQVPSRIKRKSLVYKVELSVGGVFVGESPVLNEPQWTPNAKDRLLPGQIYSWKVFAYPDATALDPLVQSPNADVELKFRTLSSQERKHLQAARPSLLPYGIALMQSGLFTEAEQVFAATLVASPGDKQVHALLARTRELRAKWLRRTQAEIERIPASIGAQAIRLEITRQLSFKKEEQIP